MMAQRGGVVVMKDVDEYIIEFSRRGERAGLVRLCTRDKYDTRCCTSQRVYFIAFSMFSPTRKSARSCSHGFLMWWIPPQDVCDWSQEDTLKTVLSSFYSSPSIWLESSCVLVGYPST